MIAVRFTPDDRQRIADEIAACIELGADLIVTSGGMSVDPDDVTREGILLAGATEVVYGTPVLPGAMFLSAVIGAIKSSSQPLADTSRIWSPLRRLPATRMTRVVGLWALHCLAIA